MRPLIHQTDTDKLLSQKPIPSFDYGVWDGFVSEGFGTLTATAIWYSRVDCL